jgi:DNA-directed RNA polymerase specialized sigma24 family protein
MHERKRFFVRVRDALVSVTREVYFVYYRSKRRDRYFERDIKIGRVVWDKAGNIVGYRPAKEQSLDRLMENGEAFAAECESVEDIALRAVMAGSLRNALRRLKDEDRALIDALFFSNNGEGMTEREYARLIGISQQSVNERKLCIFRKLKNIFKN